MLGRLRLTVDDAIDQYGQLARQVFSKRKKKLRASDKDLMFKANELEEAIKKIVKSYGLEGSADEQMMDPRPVDQVCKR
jgi:16S rRNA A1518/A1519 N6-dimethyltransferase RsmA/KsgA/DIM1 with predicted DNA glycosylase/AP lyase activity